MSASKSVPQILRLGFGSLVVLFYIST